MPYDELVKRLRDAAKMSEALAVLLPHSEGNAIAKLYNEAADAIEDLEFACNRYEKDYKDLCAYLPKWIPVVERFPEFGVRALCKCRANIYEVLTWTADGWEHDPQHIYMSGFVTHWMPLPEPPKEE